MQITLVMQPKGEVISLKAWRHRFWRDRLLLVWERRDAFWSDLWRRSDDIISLVYLLFIAEAVLRIGLSVRCYFHFMVEEIFDVLRNRSKYPPTSREGQSS